MVPSLVANPMSYNSNSFQSVNQFSGISQAVQSNMNQPEISQTQRQVHAMAPAAPVATPKRKRGRPPKPNNFSNKITKTININVNTSPLSNSPDAENNSNQMVKRGIPDIFTPTMRVSPSNGFIKKRRKKLLISSVDSISPVKRKNSGLSNQNSPTNDYINLKALDNIAQITNNSIKNPYNSPPPSTKQPSRKTGDNLLPPVLIRTDRSVSPHEDYGDFNLKLMVDDLGKAVLSHNQEEKPKLYHANTVIGIEHTYHEGHQNSDQSQTQPQPQSSGNGQTNGEMYGLEPNFADQRPAPVKYNSDYTFTDLNPPQTPKPKEQFMLNTGLTPVNQTLGFPSSNLTPLMNLIITSPKRINNNNQFLFNQDMFMNSNFMGNEFGQFQTPQAQMNHQQQSPAYYNLANFFQQQNFQFNDDSDARLALKKMIHVKRR